MLEVDKADATVLRQLNIASYILRAIKVVEMINCYESKSSARLHSLQKHTSLRVR
jgi:hypothetical protein